MRKFLLLLPFLFFFAHPAHAAITLVQNCASTCSAAGGAITSCADTCTSNIGAGHLAIGWIAAYNTGAVTGPSALTGVTDSPGSTYDYTTLGWTPNSATNNFQMAMFWTCNTGAGSGKIVTPAFPSWGGSSDATMIVNVQEYSGVATSLCLEHHLSQSLANSTLVSIPANSVATNGANDLLVTAAGNHDGSGALTTVWDVTSSTVHSYTADADSTAWAGNNHYFATEHQVEAASGTWGALNWGFVTNSHAWAAYLVSFENAANVSGFVPQIGGFLVGP